MIPLLLTGSGFALESVILLGLLGPYHPALIWPLWAVTLIGFLASIVLTSLGRRR